MKERRNVLNVKLSDLTKNWSKEFYFVCYYTYLKPEQKKEWKEAYWSKVQRRCREIEELDWESDVEYLKQCQAQAFCQTGILHTEKGNYDSARDYLEKAGDILEEFSFRYRMPECYFKTYLYLAKVYIEKHCDKDAVDDCFHKAEKVLEGRWSLMHGQRKTLADWNAGNREQFRIELDNLQIIRQSDINRENAPKDCPEDEFEKKIDQLGEHLKKMYRKYGRKRKGLAANDEKRLWVKKQMDTYYASKGVYYKGQYLEVRKAKATAEKERLLKKYFKKAAASFLHGINRDPRNTICGGNLAALLYDYQCHGSQKKYMDFAVSRIREKLSKNGALEKISKCRFADDCIQFLLDHVLRVERNNIYALNLKVLCTKEEENKEAAGRKREAYPYMPEQFVLLKKAFVNMDHCAEKWHSCEQDELREIKLDIIRLYIAVLEYMKKTIYPRDIMKGLKVAHYTRSAVLPKLINQDGGSRFRIQNVKHLNDPSEGVLFIKHLKRKLGRTQAKLDDSVINDVLKMYDYKRRDEWNRKSSVYMGAFTSQIDHLNMWSRYGEQGKGCCLWIDAEESFSDDVSVSILAPSGSEQFLYRLEDEKYPLYMLTYLPGNEKISLDAVRQYAQGRAGAEQKEFARITAEGGGAKERKKCMDEQNWWKVQARLVGDFEEVLDRLAEILDELQNDYDGYVKYIKNPPQEGLRKLREEIVNTVMIILDMARFLVKDDAYRDEREYRLIQYSYDPKYADDENGLPKLYMDVDRELKYEGVIFGPLTQNYASDSAYVLNVRKTSRERREGDGWKLQVSKSDIPYFC